MGKRIEKLEQNTPVESGDYYVKIDGDYVYEYEFSVGGYYTSGDSSQVLYDLTLYKKDADKASFSIKSPVVVIKDNPYIYSAMASGKLNKTTPVYYPKGIIMYNGDNDWRVTNAVCDTRSPSTKNYSNLYPFHFYVNYNVGDNVVWGGGIYTAKTACYETKLAPSDSYNWGLVQSAPAAFQGAVLPNALLANEFRLSCRSSTLVSDPMGATITSWASWRLHCENWSYWFNCTPRRLKTGSISSYKTTYSTYKVRSNLALEFPSGGYRSPVVVGANSTHIQDVGYRSTAYPLSVAPESMYYALDSYGQNITMEGLPFSDGNTLQVVCGGRTYKDKQYWDVVLTLDTSISMISGRVPLAILNLTDRPPNDATITFNEGGTPVPVDASVKYLNFGFMYDPMSDCVRSVLHGVMYLRFTPIYTQHFIDTGLFFYWNDWPSADTNSFSECIGQIVQILGNLTCFNAYKLNLSLKKSLLYNLFLYTPVTDCVLDIYFVKKDDPLSQTSISTFLNSTEFCIYIGRVDVCSDNIYTITITPYLIVTVPAGVLIRDADNPDMLYVSTGSFNTGNGVASGLHSGTITAPKKDAHGNYVADTEAEKTAFNNNNISSSSTGEDGNHYDNKTGEQLDEHRDANTNGGEIGGDSGITTKQYDSYTEAEVFIADLECSPDSASFGIYQATSDISSKSEISTKAELIGNKLGDIYIYNVNSISKLSPNNFCYVGTKIYMNTSSSAVIKSDITTKAKVVGQILTGNIFALYADYTESPCFVKGQYVIYRGIYAGNNEFNILRATTDVCIRSGYSNVDFNNANKFEWAGVLKRKWTDCTHYSLEPVVSYDGLPECVTVNTGTLVAQTTTSTVTPPATPDNPNPKPTTTRQTKVLNCVSPVGGGLSLEGQVLAGYLTFKAPV